MGASGWSEEHVSGLQLRSLDRTPLTDTIGFSGPGTAEGSLGLDMSSDLARPRATADFMRSKVYMMAIVVSVVTSGSKMKKLDTAGEYLHHKS